MSDPVSAAKSAREALARALGAIQSDPKAPAQMMGIAEPISNAMGALFQIEKSGGAAVAAHAPAALEATRRALGLLQQQPSNHPAVQQALEAVAGSLGLIHSLTKQAPPGQIIHDPRPAAPTAQAQRPPAAPPQPTQQAYAAQPQPPPPPHAHAAQPQHAQPTQPQPTRPRQAPPPPPQQQPANPPVQSPQAYAATYVASVAATQAAPSPYQPTMMAAQPPQAAPPVAPAAAGQGNGPSVRVDAELGAHSPSNFYKGLAGNDVVEHGGIFIATYKIPPVGQALSVHVSMPGGYEFDAAAIVRWTRETVDSSSQGASASPGFGAQFTQIAPEARQLIYRYVRNREPLFHDDL
ncbi:MAG TPA: PilZ domain-containing protein [Polyangiaceae bacterium]|nr:PilZ domain-containing protein [Polyangiaceae bacterium]